MSSNDSVSDAANSLDATESDLEALVGRIAHQDLSALGDLYDRTSPQIWGWLLQRTGSHRAASEAMVNTYRDVWFQAHHRRPRTFDVTLWIAALAHEGLRSRNSV